jgi:multiple sugar transport system ATP-binding protein
MNLIAGEVAAEGAARHFRAHQFSVALPEAFKEVAVGPATLGIRPEHIRVHRKAAEPADLTLPVRLVEPLGKDTLLYFDIASERPLIADSEGLAMAEMEAGDRIGLTLTRECLFLFGPDGRRLARGGALTATDRMQIAAVQAEP